MTGVRKVWGCAGALSARAGAELLLTEEGDSERDTSEIWLEVRGPPRGDLTVDLPLAAAAGERDGGGGPRGAGVGER